MLFAFEFNAVALPQQTINHSFQAFQPFQPLHRMPIIHQCLLVISFQLSQYYELVVD